MRHPELGGFSLYRGTSASLLIISDFSLVCYSTLKSLEFLHLFIYLFSCVYVCMHVIWMSVGVRE